MPNRGRLTQGGNLGTDGTCPVTSLNYTPKRIAGRQKSHSSVRATRAGLHVSPLRSCDTVTALCRFSAHGGFMASSSFRTTSEGTPRMAEVTGAGVTVDRCWVSVSPSTSKSPSCLAKTARQGWGNRRSSLQSKPKVPQLRGSSPSR